MFIWIFMHLWNPINMWKIEFILIWIYSKGSENRSVVVQHFWCRKICKIVCRVPKKRVKSKFLYQNADVILLADKCIVFRSFVCRDYDKVLKSFDVAIHKQFYFKFYCLIDFQWLWDKLYWLLYILNLFLSGKRNIWIKFFFEVRELKVTYL